MDVAYQNISGGHGFGAEEDHAVAEADRVGERGFAFDAAAAAPAFPGPGGPSTASLFSIPLSSPRDVSVDEFRRLAGECGLVLVVDDDSTTRKLVRRYMEVRCPCRRGSRP